MQRSEIKKRAREQIKGNVLMLFLMSLIITIITSATSFFAVGLVLAGPFSLSMADTYKGISRGEKADAGNIFKGFNNFGPAVAAYILTGLFTFFWSLLFIVPGIIKSYSYSMTMYVLSDNPEMSSTDAITESRRIMKGNKFRLFVQQLSFLGWSILSIFTFGLLLIWLAPYMEASKYNLYLDITGKNGVNVEPA